MQRPTAAVGLTSLLLLTASASFAIGGWSSCRLPQAAPAIGQAIAQDIAEIDPRIWSIHQDRSGNYWFGSNGNGVYLYDGKRITNFAKGTGLSGDQVRDIEHDSKGNVFVSTNAGVSKFDGESFTPIEVVDAPIGEKWELNPEDTWLVFNPGFYGPCRYDGDKLYHLKLTESPMEAALRARFPDVDRPPAGVYSIYKDRRGHLWFGTADAGLCRFDGQELSWMYEERLTTTPGGGAFGIRCIYQDRAGDFWICNTRQRFQVSIEYTLEDGHRLVKYEKTDGLPDAQTDTGENFTYYPSMTEDNAGSLWMACGNEGVWKYDGENVTKYTIGDGAYAMCIELDNQGKLWAGTLEQGIYTFEGEGFERFRPGHLETIRDAEPNTNR